MVQVAIVSPETPIASIAPLVPSKSSNPACPAVGRETVADDPMVVRPVHPIPPTPYPAGGTMKSPALTALPKGVSTLIFPDPASAGIDRVTLDVLAAVTLAQVSFSSAVSFAAAV